MAIEHNVIPKGEPVDLLPRSSAILSLQLQLVQKYQLEAKKIIADSGVHLRILPNHYMIDEERLDGEVSALDEDEELDDFASPNGSVNGSPYSVERLPFLPD